MIDCQLDFLIIHVGFPGFPPSCNFQDYFKAENDDVVNVRIYLVFKVVHEDFKYYINVLRGLSTKREMKPKTWYYQSQYQNSNLFKDTE